MIEEFSSQTALRQPKAKRNRVLNKANPWQKLGSPFISGKRHIPLRGIHAQGKVVQEEFLCWLKNEVVPWCLVRKCESAKEKESPLSLTLKRERNAAFPNLEAQLYLGIVFEGAARLEEQLVNAPVVEFIPVGRIDPWCSISSSDAQFWYGGAHLASSRIL